jgi:aspartyl-tRNA(Asn)/glutamyl-tRNA(Gln) amidotransferase subunit A
MSEEIARLGLVEVAEAIAGRKVSAAEVARACLERSERAQKRLNCFIAIEGEALLESARQADAELAQGRIRGPLHGVPLAHKDMFYRAGRECSCGSKIRRGFVPEVTATVLSRLEGAGALVLGRLNQAEFAVGPTGHNVHYGDCRNPWSLAHVPGGSSSGSGAAVAARLVYGALGSDTGGSVHLPSAFCGVVGLKPTQTRVSRYGMMPLSFSLDQAGPLARTARDCARLMRISAGADPLDPTCSAEPVPDYEAGLGASIKGLRIGVPTNHFYDLVDGEVGRVLEDSLAVFRSRGAELVPVAVPDHEVLDALGAVIMEAESATLHRQWLAGRSEDYSDQVRARIEPGLYVSATRYLEALDLRAVVLERYLTEVFGEVDALHTPLLSFPVPTLAETDVKAEPGFRAVIARITHCTRSINVLGLPALSVPAGFTGNGLPVAFQLIGRPFAEGRLLTLAHAYQQETDWHRRMPPE